ncbi:MAG: amino acid ABC transporter ATP-binding protein [Gammaproteobacteria bacterium]
MPSRKPPTKDVARDGEPLLRVRNLRKSFDALVVLNGVSLDVSAGEVIAIIGASGSGKSTFLRCMNLLEIPDEGDIEFQGASIMALARQNAWRRARALKPLRASIGMVFQNYNLWPHRTVLENVVEAPIRVLGLASGQAESRAGELLEMIGLADKRNQFPANLSGGQQQRVAIVRALAMRPKMMLFDEVTSALDPELVGEVLELMGRLAAGGMTMLVVTHEIDFARHVSHRTVFFDAGTIAEQGASSKILVDPENPRTRQFLSRVLHAHAGVAARVAAK